MDFFFMKIDKDLFLKLQNNIFLIMISMIMKHVNLVLINLGRVQTPRSQCRGRAF